MSDDRTCQLCPQTLNLSRCAACGIVSYCGTQHQKEDWNLHKTECKILKSRKLLDSTDVVGNSSSFTSSSSTCLKRPIAIDETLRSYLEVNCFFFNQGEYIVNSEKRCIGTTGLLVCVGIFAWTAKGKLRKDSNCPDVVLSFGAHLDAGCYLNGIGLGSTKSNGLQYLLHQMRQTFQFTDPGDVKCALVGGHLKGCPGKHNCHSMHSDILAAMEGTGYSLDKRFFKFFPGATLDEWDSNPNVVNTRLYTEQQCFFFAGMDTTNGELLLHNRFPNVVDLCPLWPPRRQTDIEIHGHQRQLSATPLLKCPEHERRGVKKNA